MRASFGSALLFLSVSAMVVTAQSESKLASNPGALNCRIGSGTVPVPVGNQNTENLLVPVSKRQNEMLAPAFSPTNIADLDYKYTSPEFRDKIFDSRPPHRLLPEQEPERLRSDVLRAVEIMIDEARSSGIDLFVHSGYRPFTTQCKIFNRKLGLEREAHRELHESQAITAVNTRSAFPGQSEHQLGTVVDFVTNIPGLGYKLEPQMETTTAFAWLQKNAHRFGFVLSYPRGSQILSLPHPQTGYIYEPWHWRYIGERDAENYRRCQQRMSMVVQDYVRILKQNPAYYCR